MRFQSKVFWVEKDAGKPEDYQDAFALDPEQGVAAIADGVTAGIFSGPWARLVSQSVVADRPNLEAESFSRWLSEQRSAWRAAIDTSRLAWYQRPKMADGGMTTLLWVELPPADAGAASVDGDVDPARQFQARAYAIGDSCLFHVRDNQLLRGFPMANTADFGANPSVLGSVNRNDDHLLEFQACDLTCQVGDLLVLCTDAVALWAMTRYENEEGLDWDRYWDLSEADWRDEIFGLRESASMRYDDSTLMLLRLAPRAVDRTEEGHPLDAEAISSDAALTDAASIPPDPPTVVSVPENESPGSEISENRIAAQADVDAACVHDEGASIAEANDSDF